MPESLERIKEQVTQLSVHERAELAHFLLQTLDGEDQLEDEAAVEAAWEAVLVRRIADFREGRVKGIPAEQVFAELRKKYS
jgi:putative addiction module component (TIGR02574 family)